MASALGHDMMLRTPTTVVFDQPSLADHVDDMASEASPLPSPQMSPRGQPPPNPPFVFPARPSSSSAPSSFSRATGRRPRSAIEARASAEEPLSLDKKPSRSPALPAFSFNPGAALGPSTPMESSFLSPPQSPGQPLSPQSIPARPGSHGHRRGGSEFVGGSIRSGDSITVTSTSPTKSESGMASPSLAPTNPSRRHAHRRSAAISSHDLSSIMMPSPNSVTSLRGSSAPNSPASIDQLDRGFSFPIINANPSKSESSLAVPSDSLSHEVSRELVVPSVELQPAPKPIARNRVGFSDTLEFIPRPLSLVSSDTSSTMTARPGHSVSGSISSIISASNADREMSSTLSPCTARKSNEPRPSTAGAVLERTQSIHDVEPDLPSPRRRGSIPQLGALPSQDLACTKPAALSPTKTPKRWSFFGLEPFVASSPTRSRPVSASSSESQTKKPPSISSSLEQVSDSSKQVEVDTVEHKPASRKRSKKQKKVKTWAGSILSRKAKARHGKQKHRGPTPPPVVHIEDMGDDLDEPSPLDITREPEPVMPMVLVTEECSDGDENPPRPASVPDDDTSYQMIDLDAALGPFATPLPRNLEWEAAQRAGGFAKKQLHSAAGMRGFSGPGMHYHRRAESAPEMVPFEAARFGFHRFGSSSTMADVFEEDEEEEDSTDKTTGQSTPLAGTIVLDSQTSLAPVSGENAVEEFDRRSVHSAAAALQTGVKRKGSDLSEDEKPQLGSKMKSEPSSASLHDEIVTEESSDFKMAMVDDVSMHDSSNSSAPSPRPSFRGKELAPVDVNPLHLPAASLAPISPYSMTQSSAFPSPRSPMSYDAHRISTAPSSITEDNFQSLLMGEPGPEVRISVDIDIPSLTSSNSTMTRESIFAHNPQARYPPLNEQPRPASFTSTAFGRRRSSLASLSRLISTSHGERSKLSMEVPMDTEPEKKAKASKSKRLSRMMQFWKPKEKSAS